MLGGEARGHLTPVESPVVPSPQLYVGRAVKATAAAVLTTYLSVS
jgi:hypothetical protein